MRQRAITAKRVQVKRTRNFGPLQKMFADPSFNLLLKISTEYLISLTFDLDGHYLLLQLNFPPHPHRLNKQYLWFLSLFYGLSLEPLLLAPLPRLLFSHSVMSDFLEIMMFPSTLSLEYLHMHISLILFTLIT